MISSVNKGALAAAIGMAVISASQAAEIKTAGRAELVTGEADLFTVVATVATGVLLVLAAIYITFSLIAPILDARSFSSSYGSRRGAPSEDLGVLGRVLNSIDPVESAFAMMNIEEIACRKRTVCELQKAASKFPIVGALLRYMSPSIRGLAEYKEAQEAGAGLEDCALLFAECPYSMLK